MKTNINPKTIHAKNLLLKENYTCVLTDGEKVFTSRERGVKPLLNLIDDNTLVEGFFASDKVVGRSASFLYVLLKIKELYALVISKPALEILQKYDISVYYETLVERIENRKKDGFCPLEEAVLNCDCPKLAYKLIKERLKTL